MATTLARSRKLGLRHDPLRSACELSARVKGDFDPVNHRTAPLYPFALAHAAIRAMIVPHASDRSERASVLFRRWIELIVLLAMSAGSHSLHALDPTQPLRHYGQQLWQTDNGLPQNTVHAIRQSGDGYLWLATDGGLVRFDGVDFTLFDRSANPQLRSNLIGALAETSDGALWAATAEGLLRRSQGSLRLYTAADGLPPGPIADVLPASAMHLWAITAEGVAYGDRSHFIRVSGLDDAIATGRDSAPVARAASDGTLYVATAREVIVLRDGRVAARLPIAADLLAPGPRGTLWMARGATLFYLNHGKAEPVAFHPPSTYPPTIQALLTADDGAVYVATPDALGSFASGVWTWKTRKDGLPADRILHLFADREGALWMSTASSVARYTQGRIETLPARSSLGVQTFFEDREGNLWLGSDAAGILELHEQRFTTLTTTDGLAGDTMRTLLADSNGVWAGTDGDGLTHLAVATAGGLTSQTLTARNGLASNTILALASQSEGALAVGTPDGLSRLAAGHASLAPENDALPDDFIRSLLEDPADGSLWIGTRRGLAHATVGSVRVWRQSDGLGSDLVGALALDRTHPGALWIATRGGLSHLESGHLSTLTTRDGLSSNIVTAICPEQNGALWIGTNGGGLNLLHHGRVTHFPSLPNGLPETIHSIIEDGRGDLWLGSPTGIYRVTAQQLLADAANPSAAIRVSSYGVGDGMRINECSTGHPAAVRTADGTLWFATLRGISITNPERQQENRLPPPVVIENVTVDDLPAPSTSSVTVPPSHTRLAFHYAGLSFVAPSRVRYRYSLAGFDAGWIDGGARRVAYYTNIPPGRYTFRVLAANNDGVWNETGAAIEVHVLPHLWQTWWFRTLMGLAALLLSYGVYRLRVHSVELRFAAVLAERSRIAREIHDTLAQDIVGIGVQLELVSRLLGSSVDAARKQLDATRGLVKSSLAEARSSIWNLRATPSTGQSSGLSNNDDLPARIHRAVNQAASQSTARARFAVHGTYRAAPRPVEDELLRVAQEAVNNAVRHAGASAIAAELRYDAQSVELLIADDGQGFTHTPAVFAQQGHFGLKGIEERAQHIGGMLLVDTGPGKGTRISLRVDIP